MFMTKLKNMCMRKGYRIESCSDIQAPSRYPALGTRVILKTEENENLKLWLRI